MTGNLDSNASGSRPRGGFGLGCLSGIAFAVVLMIVLGVIVRRGPERFPGPVRALFGAGDVIVTTEGGGEAALSLEQIRAIRGVQPTIQVTLTEEDINSYVRENPESIGLPKEFKNPRVKFADGRVRLLVSTKVLLFSTRITIAMEPRVEAGQLVLEVKKIEAGGIDLPGEVRQVAEQQVADLLAERLNEAGLRPESVEVAEGKLVIAARLVPVDAPPEAEAEPEDEEPVEEEAAEAAEPAAEEEDASGEPHGRDWWPGR